VKFNHVAIRVRDLDASVRFLQAVLGPEATTIELADTVTLVGTEDGVFFDLFSEGGAAPENGPEHGLIHYALGVDDVDSAFVTALEAGAREKAAPVTMTTSSGEEIRAAYVYDPNGDVCEFVSHDWIEKVQGS
jgi:catechol 2,3-dioxygenase-like lactoylglutathione lyase family enzyme